MINYVICNSCRGHEWSGERYRGNTYISVIFSIHLPLTGNPISSKPPCLELHYSDDDILENVFDMLFHWC